MNHCMMSHLRLITFLFLITVASQTINAIPLEEFEFLKEFYNKTNGDDWYNNTGWQFQNVSHKDICTIIFADGLRCSYINKDTHIKSMIFNYNNLNGPIPYSMTNLSYLSALQLYGENITSSITDIIYNIPSITDFQIAFCDSISFEIDERLCNLTNLQTIVLQESVYTRVNSMVNGTIPNCINQLQSLTDIEIIC